MHPNSLTENSHLSILQGLMKLRQICDSPAIIKDETYPNESVKLTELTREIVENIGDHKALVFSQFLGMLGLIKEEFVPLNCRSHTTLYIRHYVYHPYSLNVSLKYR